MTRTLRVFNARKGDASMWAQLSVDADDVFIYPDVGWGWTSYDHYGLWMGNGRTLWGCATKAMRAIRGRRA